MVLLGGAGLRVPRKRVVGSGMWLQQDSSIVNYNDSSMCKASGSTDYETSVTSQDSDIVNWNGSSICKVTGSRDFETSSILHSSAHGVSDPALSSRALEGIHVPNDGERSIKYECPMSAALPEDRENSPPWTWNREEGEANLERPQTWKSEEEEAHFERPQTWKREVEEGHFEPPQTRDVHIAEANVPESKEEEADCELQTHGHLPEATGIIDLDDDDIDISVTEFDQLMREGKQEGMSPPTINCEMGYTPIYNEEVSNLSRSDGKEMVFLSSSEQEGLQCGTQQMEDDPLFRRSLSTQEPLQSGTGFYAPDASGLDLELRPSLTCDASQLGPLSNRQTNISSFFGNLNDDSWHSASTVGQEGREALESASGSSAHLPIVDDGTDGQSSENMNFVGTPRSLGYDASCMQPSYNIDHDRPSQTYGSVLASEAMLTGGIHSLDSAQVAKPLSTGFAVHKQVTSLSDVVDLSSDSDDDTIDQWDHVRGHLKRKTQDQGDINSKKKLNIFGVSSEHSGRDIYDYKTQLCRSKNFTPGRISDWQMSLGEDSRTKSGSSVFNQVPQQSNNALTPHISLHGGPGSFVNDNGCVDGGRSVQFLKGCGKTISDKRNSIHLSAHHDLDVSRKKLPASLEVSATTASLMKEPLVGSNLEEATPDEGLLSVPLLTHQRVALAWMEKRELGGIPQGGILADDQGLGKTVTTISLILKARAPIQTTPVEAGSSSRPGALTVELEDDDDVSHAAGQTQAVSISVAEKDSSLPLALDSVGIGLSRQSTEEEGKAASSKRRPAAGTLVVCPTSVLRQWAHEIKEKVTDLAALSVLIYHGSNRTRDPDELAKYDVVLTTYSIVSMEVPKQPLPDEKDNEKKMPGGGESDIPTPFRYASKAKKPKKATENGKKSRGNGKGRLVEGENGSIDLGPLARLNWFRVVLDEAQSIKNARTQVARAAWGLRAKRRWCLSGTPIQNAIDDLYSYFRFLRYSPYDSYKEFREQIKDPCTRMPTQGFEKLQRCLLPVMIRRTKGTLINGTPIVNLPPRIVTLRQAEFNEEERAFYNNLECESRKQFKDYAAAGTLQSNYVNILWMLLRLRQACDHPLLVKGHKYQGAQSVVNDSAKKLPIEKRLHLLSLLEANRDICSICNDLPDEAVICICTHIFCRQCISEQLATGDDTCCPLPKCRKSLNTSLIYTLASLKSPEPGEGSSSGGSLFLEPPQHDVCKSTDDVDWKSSSKIDAVIDTLSALPPIYVIVENGRVVVQASKDLQDLKLCGTSCMTIINQEPPLLANSEPDSLVKGKSVSVVKEKLLSGETEIIPDMRLCAPSVKAEKIEPGQADVARETDTVTRYSAAFKAVKHEAVSTALMSMQEPFKRQIVESTEKAIVFSQWTSMLDLLEVKLKEAKFNYRRLDGTMSVLARDRAVSDFKTLPEVTVIIMSLKAASLGLNMVAACHVLLLDVWWNPTTEDQAIDRAHRIGQTKTVNVSRFTVKDTIEDRILELQEKKRRMVASAFGGALHKCPPGLSVTELRHLFGV